MKKTLIALAVAGVSVATAPVALADAGAYGSLRTAITYFDDGSDSDQSKLSITDEASRFGFKGMEDLGNGMSGVYRYEFSVSSNQTTINANNRLSYVGLKGGFGEVTIGRHWAPFYEAVASGTDTFNGIDARVPGGITSAANANDGRGPSIRTGNSLKYSNAFGGVKLGVMGVMQSDAATDEDEIDRIDISLSGKAGALSWGVGVVSDSESLGDDSTFGVMVGFAVNKDLSLTGVVVQQDNDGFTGSNICSGLSTDDCGETTVSLGIDFSLGGGNSIQGRFTQISDAVDTLDIGWQTKLSGRTRVFVELGTLSPDADGADDTTELALGVRHDF